MSNFEEEDLELSESYDRGNQLLWATGLSPDHNDDYLATPTLIEEKTNPVKTLNGYGDNYELGSDHSKKTTFVNSSEPPWDFLNSEYMNSSQISDFRHKQEVASVDDNQILNNLEISFGFDFQTPDNILEDNLKGAEVVNNALESNLQSTGGTNLSVCLPHYPFNMIEDNTVQPSSQASVFYNNQEIQGGAHFKEPIQLTTVDFPNIVQTNFDAPGLNDFIEHDSMIREREEIQEEVKGKNEFIQKIAFHSLSGVQNTPKPYALKNFPKYGFVAVRRGCWSYWGKKGGINLSCISARLKNLSIENPQQEMELKRFLNECHGPSTTWEGLKDYIRFYTKGPEHYEVVGLFHDMLVDLLSNEKDLKTWLRASTMSQETKDRIIAQRARFIDEIRNQVH